MRNHRKEAEDMGRILRAIVGIVLLLGFLVVVIFVSQATFTASNGRHVDRDFRLNYVSKRRVPNGPDPIHNRGVGKSNQPPG